MRFCIFCGKEIPQDATYCQICGKEQPPLEEPIDSLAVASEEKSSSLPLIKFLPKSMAAKAALGAGVFLVFIAVLTGVLIVAVKK